MVGVQGAMNAPRELALLLSIGLLIGVLLARARGASEFAVEIDLQEQRAYLLRHGRMILESPVSTGRANYRTPTGRFQITEKDMDHRSSLYGKIVDARGRTIVADADADMSVPAGAKFVNAPMHYFMRFTEGIGMHAGYLPGYAASHGCVRMPAQYAAEFYRAVEIGTPVTVFGTTGNGRAPAPAMSRPRVPSRPGPFWWLRNAN
jgi:lipoprotein-anchoring transpeptidase ErfK/SrfK